jgi:hypothetical protein
MSVGSCSSIYWVIKLRFIRSAAGVEPHATRSFLPAAKFAAFVAAIVFSTCSAGTRAADTAASDPLCAPLLTFAASVQPDESRTIVFNTCWGGNCGGADNRAIASNACAHAHGDEAGKAVCAALSEHGNIERSDLNALRVLKCLAPETNFGRVRLNAGDFSLTYGTPDRGAQLSVVFGDDDRRGKHVLRIVAEGY